MILLRGGIVYSDNRFAKNDILIKDGIVADIGDLSAESEEENEKRTVIDCDDCLILPGLIDVHVHFRQPGFEYKETIATGSRAAAAGGYTTVCTMPNLDPAPCDNEGLHPQIVAIKKDACVKVIPYGRITMPSQENDQEAEGSMKVSQMEEMAPYVFAFSDDGAGVQQKELMHQAMVRAKKLGKIIVAHSEDTRYAPDDPRSEYKQIERDLELAAKTGCPYHVCHVSAKESVELIRQGKKSGVDVTCETAPHYLIFSREEIEKRIAGTGAEKGGRFKMNPPVRHAADREALLQAVADGTVDMIATDHAPHSAEEKSKGFEGSMNGIIGLETAFPVMYTELVERNIISRERLVRLMSSGPADRFGIEGGRIEKGASADIMVADTENGFVIDPESFRSKGRSTPFEGMKVKGKTIATICQGRIAYMGR